MRFPVLLASHFSSVQDQGVGTERMAMAAISPRAPSTGRLECVRLDLRTSLIALWEVLPRPHRLQTMAKSKEQSLQQKIVQPERWDRVEGKDKRMRE